MRNGHNSSRREAYGRRMKDLRTRRGKDVVVDLDGPADWSRGEAWDPATSMHRSQPQADRRGSSPSR